MVLRVPEGIELDEAAPLLCAGITTYSPLKRWGAGPGRKVAVVGVGGLGHMGVKLAAAMGAEVTTLSRSADKADDAKALGSSNHIATSDEARCARPAGSFDLILNTVSADLDMEAYLRLLRPNGALVNVGLPPSNLSVKPGSLIIGNKVDLRQQHRRHRRDPGDARLLRRARHRRDRRAPRRERHDDDRRGIRRGRGRQGALPLRHRHLDDPPA